MFRSPDQGQYDRSSTSPQEDSDSIPDAGPTLRAAFRIPPGTPVNLNALPDPPPGQRPDATLDTLVQLAIYGSARGKLTLQEIYSAIEDRFEYYRTTDPKWKGSIRHMLSLKSVFVPTERPANAPGRGNYWQLNPAVTMKYKRDRKRRPGTRGRSITDDGSHHHEETSHNNVELSPAPYAGYGLNEMRSTTTSNTTPSYPFTATSTSGHTQSTGLAHQPSPGRSNYDPRVVLRSNEAGFQQSSALIHPSNDAWWGVSPPSPDPNTSNSPKSLYCPGPPNS